MALAAAVRSATLTGAMPPLFENALRLCWLSVIVYWTWSARYVKSTAAAEGFPKQALVYWVPFAIAIVLLGPGDWYGHGWLREQFVPHTTWVYSIGLALAASGVVLAVYARSTLGANWSGNVTLKDGHTLITTGPYGAVRHPIYTGFLLLFFGNAIMVGDWRGLIAVAIVLASFWLKLSSEEKLLQKRFGEAFAAYRRKTSALVPGIL